LTGQTNFILEGIVMFHVKTLNHISPACREILTPDRYTISEEMEKPDAIFVRATNMLNYEFNPELLCIARAGIGVNSIPLDRCTEEGIAVFNSPGANANGVKELFVFGLSMASRDLLGAVNWVYHYHNDGVPVEVAMEKIKKQFSGPEYAGKILGVVGTGNVGCLTANIALDLGMTVYAYDPYLSVDAAWKVSRDVKRVADFGALLRSCDYLTLHVPLTDETRDMVDDDAIACMKDNVRIINYARGEVINEDALIRGLESGKIARYVTDFPTDRLIRTKNVVATPHLGGTTIESEANCAVMAAREMDDYLCTGNIKNSVNLPTLVQERSGMARLCIIHRNVPNMLASITSALSATDVNVENLTNKSRGNYAYTVVDVNTLVDHDVIQKIRSIGGILRVRALNH
jgi:D-3-phosphoglycerate dehydrogenase